jgi:hypothetical protein
MRLEVGKGPSLKNTTFFIILCSGVNVIKLFSFITDVSLESLSSQGLEFEGKARANPIEAPFRCFLLLLVLPPNIRLDWKVIAMYKHLSLFSLVISNKGKKFYNIDTWAQCYKTFFDRN